MPDEAERNEKPEKETARLEAFSDGVFAIAITLLALELKIPHLSTNGALPSSRALASTLAHEWPGYFSFITSFFTVLIMWVHHHSIFRLVRRTDIFLLFANGFLLMLVTVVPFPTAVVSEYLTTPAAPAACALYAGIFVGISIAFFILIRAAFRPGILDPDASQSRIQHLQESYRFGPPLYLAATIVAPFSPWLSMGICTALWIFWAATTKDC